jgi:PilZ domain
MVGARITTTHCEPAWWRSTYSFKAVVSAAVANCFKVNRLKAGPDVWFNRIVRTRWHPWALLLSTRTVMTPVADAKLIEPVDAIDDRRSNPDRRANSDRRRSPRKKVLKGGRTAWQNGDSTECIVHNLSATGAHLQIRGPVPRTFNLIIDGDQVSRSCCVVWRNANRVGVRFESQLEIAGLTSSFKQHANQCRTLADRVAALDREALLRMADAWESLTRRFRMRRGLAERTSY